MSDRGYLIPGASTTSHATPYMTLQIPEEKWMDDAACLQVDPDLFFPEGGGSGSHEAQRAKTVCRGCDVQAQCLAYALKNDEDEGIWGMTSSRERRKLRRDQKRGVS